MIRFAWNLSTKSTDKFSLSIFVLNPFLIVRIYCLPELQCTLLRILSIIK